MSSLATADDSNIEIIKPIGFGAFANVYEVCSSAAGPRESQAVDKISNAGDNLNVIKILSTFSSAEYLYVDMELCHFNLEEYIHNWNDLEPARINTITTIKNLFRSLPGFGNLDPDMALNSSCLYYGLCILMQVASGLDFIHGLRLVHRDIKPRNSNSL